MKVVISFNIDNHAFQEDMHGEVNQILSNACEKLMSGDCDYHPMTLMDSNGNTVGTVSIEEDESDE
jgi:hypothetical protein